jgi:DNA-binding beta-propeller fold protein YncE
MTRKPFRLAVADSGSHRLLVFKYPVLQLAFRHGVAHKPSPLPEHLNAPHACALSSSGSRWYVADTGNHRVLVLDADSGAVEASIGQHCGLREAPRGVALAKHSDSIASDVASLDQRGACTIRGAALPDRLWVASSSTHTVQCFDLSGRAPRLVLELGGGKDTPSRQADMQSFRWPMGLACFAGRVFVADRGNDRVQVLDEASGGHRYTITGSRSARLLKPEGVAVDRRRSVLYVSDTGNQCICAFDAAPPFAFRGRTLGDRVEGLQHMAVDESSGEVICSDAKQNRILVFNPI